MRFTVPLLLLLAACSSEGTVASTGDAPADGGVDGEGLVEAGPSCTEPAYPQGPYGSAVGATLGNRTWPGVKASGAAGSVALGDALSGCPDDPPVLVLRIDAAWCGTCQSYAAHSRTLLASDIGSRVRLFDVVLFDRDNAPASTADAPAWQALEDVPTETGVDPMISVQDLLPASTQLPVMLVIDARTMILEDVLSNPTEDALEQSVRTAWAAIDGQPAPSAPAPVLVDGRFTRDEWDLIAQMSLTDPPPPDPSNTFADSIPAAALGGKVFADTRLSPTDTVACSSCHQAARQLTDGFPTSPDGVGRVTRNSPSLTFAAYTRWEFYDGRADSLWSQALDPTEAPNEYGSSRLFIAHAIATYYQPQYQVIFGPMPPMGDMTRFPPSGMPGDPAYDAMAPADQQAVTQVFVNMGKSIEAYERTFRGAGATLDSYAGGESTALTDAQKDGLLAFLQSGCGQCHYGPRLTDDAFHVLRFPSGSLELGADPGRQAGIPLLLASAFDLGSPWSDDTSLARPPPVPGAWTLGAFKTPQLRNVALTSPYGHGGNYANLSDVVELIRTGGMPAGSSLTEGTTEPWLVMFDQANDAPITTFLESLDMLLTH
jgi:cytochrome c peroxidase